MSSKKQSTSTKKKIPVVKEDFGEKNAELSPPIIKPNVENMFDLTKLVEIQHEEQVKKDTLTITHDEQTALLIGYDDVPPSEWETLPRNIHVRYLRKDGHFRRGGFVKNIWIDAVGKHKGRKCIQLSSTADYKATKWVICFDDIDKIWKKNIENTPSTHQATPSIDISGIAKNSESIEYLTTSMEQLKIKMSRLQNEQTRIVNLIKKLHHI